MMGRLKSEQGQLFYQFQLGDAVPEDHLVRKIDAALDLSWLRSELAPHYSSTGRPSIDPELMIRMLVVARSRARRSYPPRSFGRFRVMMDMECPLSRAERTSFEHRPMSASGRCRPLMRTGSVAGLAQPDLQPMDGTVVFEWEGERPRGDLGAIELRRRDASLHALRVLDHDLVP